MLGRMLNTQVGGDRGGNDLCCRKFIRGDITALRATSPCPDFPDSLAPLLYIYIFPVLLPRKYHIFPSLVFLFLFLSFSTSANDVMERYR